jgi:hypothetical protein
MQLLVTTDPTWRTTYVNNVETSRPHLGRGVISFKLVDEVDGILNNNNTDPVRVYGYGRVGNATKVCSAKMSSSAGAGYTCLNVAVAAVGTVSLGGALSGPTITGSETISTNSVLTAQNCILNAMNLEAVGLITVLTSTGTGTRNACSARTYPDSTVFDFYKTNGTSISYGSTGGSISRKLITPSANPIAGGTNASGIYVIDCAGGALTITGCRIVGTLVILNASTVTLSTQLAWEPAVRGYPCLLVQGNLTWSTASGTLHELGSPSVNFNPPGAPYPYNYGGSGGTTNLTSSDTFANQINGLVYCSGNLTLSGYPTLNKGILIAGGSMTCASGTVAFTYDSYYASAPPPGFSGASIALTPGTWRWELAQ